MSIVKSFSVGDGDMFYIKHNSDNFTTIDCCNYSDGTNVDWDLFREHLKEIKNESRGKKITRFISTHPDNDHIGGLEEYDNEIRIINFYCIENKATKSDETDDFNKYCELRDGDKHFYLYKGRTRKWMNISDNERGSAGINCLWPIISNEYYKKALEEAKKGNSPNNISPIITYSESARFMWLGDIESDFVEKIKGKIEWEKIDILFAPHHGRKTGKLPSDVLKILNPKIVIIGEASSKNLNYYHEFDTITQNSAGDIIFECMPHKVHVFVSNENYSVDFLDNENQYDRNGGYYLGTLNL